MTRHNTHETIQKPLYSCPKDLTLHYLADIKKFSEIAVSKPSPISGSIEAMQQQLIATLLNAAGMGITQEPCFKKAIAQWEAYLYPWQTLHWCQQIIMQYINNTIIIRRDNARFTLSCLHYLMEELLKTHISLDKYQIKGAAISTKTTNIVYSTMLQLLSGESFFGATVQSKAGAALPDEAIIPVGLCQQLTEYLTETTKIETFKKNLAATLAKFIQMFPPSLDVIKGSKSQIVNTMAHFLFFILDQMLFLINKRRESYYEAVRKVIIHTESMLISTDKKSTNMIIFANIQEALRKLNSYVSQSTFIDLKKLEDDLNSVMTSFNKPTVKDLLTSPAEWKKRAELVLAVVGYIESQEKKSVGTVPKKVRIMINTIKHDCSILSNVCSQLASFTLILYDHASPDATPPKERSEVIVSTSIFHESPQPSKRRKIDYEKEHAESAPVKVHKDRVSKEAATRFSLKGHFSVDLSGFGHVMTAPKILQTPQAIFIHSDRADHGKQTAANYTMEPCYLTDISEYTSQPW